MNVAKLGSREVHMFKPAMIALLAFAPMAAFAQSNDLTGVWQGPYTSDLTRGTAAVLTPWGQEQFAKFDGKQDPCLPVGVTRQANAPDPIQIVQTPSRLVILYESWHIFRSIHTDGRDHTNNLDLTWF